MGLQLARDEERFVVAEGWKITFGEEHGWSTLDPKDFRAGLIPWYIISPGASLPGTPAGSPTFLLRPSVLLTCTPPALVFPAGDAVAEISFLPAGDASAFILEGWAPPKPTGTWTEQKVAALCFRPPPISGTSVEVALAGFPLLHPAAGLTSHGCEPISTVNCWDPNSASRRTECSGLPFRRRAGTR